jgi:S1-C subfamily serine protease
MAQVLTGFSEALAETVAAGGAYTVRVEGRDRTPASGIVWANDGVIVTAHHILERDEEIQVGLPDGRTLPATLVGRDPTTDLAVLRVQAGGLAAPALAELDSLRVGHLALALGRPGQSVRATLGIVSALGSQPWRTPGGGMLDRYLQTDLTMYPGFSGGPLVDAAGAVVGLNSSALLRGVTMTVPVSTIQRVVQSLLAHGRVRRGYLGVGTQPVRLPEATARQLGQETGLLLVSVEAGSPAERARLFLGDVIVALAGQPVRHLDDLFALLSADRVGAPAAVKVLRGGQVQELSVTVGEHPYLGASRGPTQPGSAG